MWIALPNLCHYEWRNLKARKEGGWYCPGPALYPAHPQVSFLKIIATVYNVSALQWFCLFPDLEIARSEGLDKGSKKSQTWAVGFDHLLLLEHYIGRRPIWDQIQQILFK